jgi:hypothetical protein
VDGVSTDGNSLALKWAGHLRLSGGRSGRDAAFLLLHLVNLFERTVAFNAGVRDGQILCENTAPQYPRQRCDRAQSLAGDFHQRHFAKRAHDVSEAIFVPFFMSSVISQITSAMPVAWIHTRVQLAQRQPLTGARGRSFRHCCERLLEIVEDVLDGLDSHGQPDQAVADAHAFAMLGRKLTM